MSLCSQIQLLLLSSMALILPLNWISAKHPGCSLSFPNTLHHWATAVACLLTWKALVLKPKL